VTRRYAHSRPVSYAPRGMDAAVAYGELDLVFQNPYESILTFRAEVEDDLLRIRILGRAPDFEVEFQHLGHATVPFPRQEITSKFITKPRRHQKGREGRPGTSVWTYYRDGEQFDKVVVMNQYKPIPEIWIVPVDSSD
jgi:hypothetical protein